MPAANTFEAHKKAAKRAITSIRKTKGVEANIYFPLSISTRQGFQDDNIDYPSEPSLSEKVLIPGIYRHKGASFSFIVDPFGEDSSNFIYLPYSEDPYPRFSKIILDFENTFQTFRIENWEGVNTPSGLPYYRGTLTLVTTIPTSNVIEKIETLISEEDERVANGELMDYSITGNTKGSGVKQYAPIK